MPDPLECLTPEAINNRFVAATGAVSDLYIANMLKEDPWLLVFRENRIKEIMKKHKCSRAKALKIKKAEDKEWEKEWEKEYNSPLKVAERRIQALEDELARIKRVVNGEEDPDDY